MEEGRLGQELPPPPGPWLQLSSAKPRVSGARGCPTGGREAALDLVLSKEGTASAKSGERHVCFVFQNKLN